MVVRALLLACLTALTLSVLIPAPAADLNDYCKGYCQARYQGGFYAGAGRCGCVDYISVNTNQRFDVPKKRIYP